MLLRVIIGRYAEEIMKAWLSLQSEKHKGRIREDGKVKIDLIRMYLCVILACFA